MGLTARGLVRDWFTLFIALILQISCAVSIANADLPQGEASFCKGFFGNLESEFTLTAGMRSDRIEWSIASSPSGGSPNILSELIWSDVDSYQLSLSNRSHINKNLYFRGSFQYGWIRDGRVRDSDYSEDFRNAEWSRSISETSDDDVWDASFGGGYAFFFMQDRLSVAPLLGFSYHKQNLRIANGNQLISQENPFSPRPEDQPPVLGPLPSQLNSTYFSRWMGPWVGCDFRYKLKDRSPRIPPIQLGLSVEIHWVDYHGEGNWNLRSDLAHPKSFEHETRGKGLSLTGECLIKLAAHWDLALNLNFQEWSTTRGSDLKHLASGGTVKTRLNKVNWDSNSFMIGAVYRF